MFGVGEVVKLVDVVSTGFRGRSAQHDRHDGDQANHYGRAESSKDVHRFFSYERGV
jgi:hypothetical protein